MKTVNELLTTTVTLNDFAGYSAEDIMGQFSATHTNEHIVIANYTYEDYSGSAWVLFVKDNELYEVHGGHCSCYGLEDQWTPELVCLPELVNRVANSRGDWVDESGVALKLVLGLA